MPDRLKLTQAQEDYLKAVFQVAGRGGSVSTSRLAGRLGVSAASATEMLSKLAAQGLVVHDRYRGASLSARGERAALEMIRHHRLLEMYLVEKLGYGWDEVHEEAERLEHAISERLEQRMFEALGRPALDPHGDPIPSAGGVLKGDRGQRDLSQCRAGEELTVRRVSDRDPDKLRHLEKLGVRLGSAVEVVAESRFEGPIRVRVDGRRRDVALGVARAVFVS